LRHARHTEAIPPGRGVPAGQKALKHGFFAQPRPRSGIERPSGLAKTHPISAARFLPALAGAQGGSSAIGGSGSATGRMWGV